MRWQFYRRMPVFGEDGTRIGRTVEIAHADDYVLVQQGNVLVTDWYVPMTAVAGVTGEGVRLNVNLPDLRRNRWNVPPLDYLEEQGATPGYEYTSPSDLVGDIDPEVAGAEISS